MREGEVQGGYEIEPSVSPNAAAILGRKERAVHTQTKDVEGFSSEDVVCSAISVKARTLKAYAQPKSVTYHSAAVFAAILLNE